MRSLFIFSQIQISANVLFGKRLQRQNFRYVASLIVVLQLFAVALAASEVTQTAASGNLAFAAPDTRYIRTVAYVESAPEALQVEFVATSLAALASAHAREAALAREELELLGPNVKLQSWSIAVDDYANQLLALRDELHEGALLGLAVTVGGSVAVKVNTTTTILLHPRADQQSTFEQHILAEFCSRHPCQEYVYSGEPPEPIPVSAAKVRPAWNFTETGPVCSHRGIEVRFAQMDELTRARLTCEQFLQEVMALRDEMAWQRGHDVSISWGDLQIQSTPGAPQHRVQLNAAGDSILIVIPLLSISRELFAAVQPWLQAQLATGQESKLILLAADYGWES